MWEMIRGYLTFTRKERLGVLFLLVLISVVFVLPYFFRPAVGDPDPAAYEKMKASIRKFDKKFSDSSHDSVDHDRDSGPGEHKSNGPVLYSPPMANGRLFYFDPNKLNADGWKSLGISDRLTQTILRYSEKGGHFRRAEDLKKLYGLRNSDYERIFPYVRFENSNNLPKNFDNGPAYKLPHGIRNDSLLRVSTFSNPYPMKAGTGFTFISKKLVPTDINLADSVGWSQLPGIGSKLAARIVHFRDKLGGFYNIDQVGETFGLPDSVFQKIKPVLHLSTPVLHQINLNIATKEILQAHPYIRWQIAGEIIAFRQQHGNFHSVEELMQLAQMSQEKFDKLKPYLMIEQ